MSSALNSNIGFQSPVVFGCLLLVSMASALGSTCELGAGGSPTATPHSFGRKYAAAGGVQRMSRRERGPLLPDSSVDLDIKNAMITPGAEPIEAGGAEAPGAEPIE